MDFNGKQKKLYHVGLFLIIGLFLLSLFCTGVQANEVKKHPVPDETKLKAIIEDFERYVEKSMQEWQVPGMAIAIIQGDKVIYSKGFGVKKLGESDHVTENTLFQIGSTSKAFTATMIAQLVDEGKLSWNDRVIDHLPDFMMYDPWVTREFRVKDLMAQRSGMHGNSGDLQAFMGYGREHIINSLRYIKPVNSFRSEFTYHNGLFLVAGKLIEKKTGKTWEQNLKERIFDPLEMHNSSADMKSYVNSPDAAYMHTKKDGKVFPFSMDWKAFNWPYVYGPAGGINSNLVDMVKWVQLNYSEGKLSDGKQLVSKENLSFLHTPATVITKTPKGEMLYYCQGWGYLDSSPYPEITHSGGTSGSGTMVSFIPKADLGIVIFSNYITPLPGILRTSFQDRYFDRPIVDHSAETLKKVKEYELKAQTGLQEVPKKPIPPLTNAAYTGEYENRVYGKMTVWEKNGKLFITAGPYKIQWNLKHFDANRFTFSIPDVFSFSDQGNYLVFETDAKRNVTGFKINIFEKEGTESFTRVPKKQESLKK
jgi:CubicO group peptidase (beta-lactamase class C family)